MKARLHAPERHGAAHGCLDEPGEGLAILQHGFKLGTQVRLDTDLGDDGGLHGEECIAFALRPSPTVFSNEV